MTTDAEQHVASILLDFFDDSSYGVAELGKPLDHVDFFNSFEDDFDDDDIN
ncbi:hypothetical protein HPP92_016446 [Vanilla planifolia]|uniref:Uncharacterized protein n=1 Tax=Vanilla planifolia TaxID=51239 RepID=A0A835QK36_VANPL|nr:hypothetical protein HPP92_016446 [Vanilla planifolia]